MIAPDPAVVARFEDMVVPAGNPVQIARRKWLLACTLKQVDALWPNVVGSSGAALAGDWITHALVPPGMNSPQANLCLFEVAQRQSPPVPEIAITASLEDGAVLLVIWIAPKEDDWELKLAIPVN